MRKILTLIALLVAFTFVFSSNVGAIENIKGGAGVALIVESGHPAAIGYYIEGDFPWGINNKSVDVSTNDTTITFELTSGVQLLYSDFAYKDYAETEAEVFLNGARKSLGFANGYIGAGLSIWHFRGTGTTESGPVGNTTRDGYFLQASLQPFSGVTLGFGAHLIPITDGNDTYATTLGLRIGL